MVEEYKPEKVGVWIENGLVYRSDIGEPRNPYKPKEGHIPEEVADLLSQIQRFGCISDKPDPSPRIHLDDLLDRLDKIAIERSRFIVQEGKNLLSESLR